MEKPPFSLLSSALLAEVLVEERNGLHALVELRQSVTLVWRVYSIFRQTETDKYRLDTQDALKTAYDRN